MYVDRVFCRAVRFSVCGGVCQVRVCMFVLVFAVFCLRPVSCAARAGKKERPKGNKEKGKQCKQWKNKRGRAMWKTEKEEKKERQRRTRGMRGKRGKRWEGWKQGEEGKMRKQRENEEERNMGGKIKWRKGNTGETIERWEHEETL